MNSIQITPSNARKTVPATEHRRVALRAYTALFEMANGTARREEFQDLCDSVNVVDALGTMGKLDPAVVRPLVNSAIVGLVAAIQRPPGSMRMSAASLEALRGIVTLHDEAISRFSLGTMHQALTLVNQKIADPSANAESGLIVVNG